MAHAVVKVQNTVLSNRNYPSPLVQRVWKVSSRESLSMCNFFTQSYRRRGCACVINLAEIKTDKGAPSRAVFIGRGGGQPPEVRLI